MELLVDREITGAETAYQRFGQVRLFAGRELTAATLGAAEVLLVRSVTRVDRALLAGSHVRFVGMATAGTDHIDMDYLAAAGIAADVPGCARRGRARRLLPVPLRRPRGDRSRRSRSGSSAMVTSGARSRRSCALSA